MALTFAPVRLVDSGGLPVTVVTSGYGTPMTVVDNIYSTPVTGTSNGGMPVLLYNADGSPFFEPETDALAARFTVPPTFSRKVAMNTLIAALKTGGVWSKLDTAYFTAAADAQAARRNAIADLYNLTAISSPAFSADRGYTGDGAASYLESGFNPTTAPGAKFTLNSGTMFVWLRTNISGQDMGNTRSRLIRQATSGRAACFPNNASQATVAEGAFPGLAAWSRSASGVWEGYGNGVDGGGGTDASTTLTSETLRLCMATNVGYSTNQVAAAGWGGNLTAAEHLALFNAVRTYLQAVGAA